MDRLRALFEELGFSDVASFLASGNVVFDATDMDEASLERQIECHLEPSLGYEVPTFIRTLPELAAIAAHRPFAVDGQSEGDHALYVVLLRNALSAEAQKEVSGLRTEVDDFRVHGRELYWRCRGRISNSEVSPAQFERATEGMPVTRRNVRTIRRLAAKFAVAEE